MKITQNARVHILCLIMLIVVPSKEQGRYYKYNSSDNTNVSATVCGWILLLKTKHNDWPGEIEDVAADMDLLRQI